MFTDLHLFPSSSQALTRLKLGNERYVAGDVEHRHQSASRRLELVENQQPFAVVLGCSDSRVPPEVLFDYGLGDLFVVRTAGHVVDDIVLASIEYAAVILQTRLVVVLGHENCGAVKATAARAKSLGHLGAVMEAIRPAVARAEASGAGDVIDAAIHNHVTCVARQLTEQSRPLERLCASGLLRIVPAVTELASGRVRWLL